MSSTSRVDVGTPPGDFKDRSSINVCFHGFANLPTTRNQRIHSTKFSCLGHQWRLDIFPSGYGISDEGYVDVELVNRSNTSIKIEYGYSVRNADGKEHVHYKSIHEFGAHGSGRSSGRCTVNFAKRTKLIELLESGSLIIEVRMKATTNTTTNKSMIQFIPTNPINKNILKLFMNEETADVLFEVGGQQQTKGTRRKRAKTSATSFHAHRNILQNCAPTLYEMCGKSDGSGITRVSITDVSPEIFKHMIYYAYGGKLSADDLTDNAKDIINACDKYGVVHLKLEAEACYVKSIEITTDNMMDNLLYADSKNLALLKEAVMDFIVKNMHSIMGRVSFDNVPGSSMTDLLAAMARGAQTTDVEGEEEDESIKYNKMRVGTLRKMLDEKGLDVDGSRETMIALLKENSA